MAFAANAAGPAAGAYTMAAAPALSASVSPIHSPGLNLTVLSCHPTMGTYGTSVSLKLSSPYDMLSMAATGTGPYVSVLFGPQRCAARLKRDGQDAASGAWTYTVTAEAPAPQFLQPSGGVTSVPLALVVESAGGEELARAEANAFFTYHEAHTHAHAHAAESRASAGLARHGALGHARKGSGSSDAHPRASPPQQVSLSAVDLPVRTSSSSAAGPSSAQHHGGALTVTGTTDASGTHMFGYPPGAVDADAHAQSTFAAAYSHSDNNNNNNTLLTTYRGASYADPYARAPPPPSLRSPGLHHPGGGWSAYGGASHLGPIRTPHAAAAHHQQQLPHNAVVTRPSLTTLPHPATSNMPQLVRTSLLSSVPSAGAGAAGSSSAGAGAAGGGHFNPYAVFPPKATLKIAGDLDAMAENWTQEEWDNKRRIVMFKKAQQGGQLTTSFRAVSVAERPPHSICVSCIYWAEKQECFVTSVDTIHLLEQLVVSPNRFGVDEKNRIRRNLEGFHPATVSKSKAESEDFFKVIMAFGNPKPRNIEKDVKVFPWKVLGPALKKIISKYSVSPASASAAAAVAAGGGGGAGGAGGGGGGGGGGMPPGTPTQLLTPVSVSGSYPPLAGPGTATTAPDTGGAMAGYVHPAPQHHGHAAHYDGSSPRSWAAYAHPSTRALSPGGGSGAGGSLGPHKRSPSSPAPGGGSGLRLATLPPAVGLGGVGMYADGRMAPGPYGAHAAGYGQHQHQHPHPHPHPHPHHTPVSAAGGHGRSWDGAGGYAAVGVDGSGYGGGHHGHHGHGAYAAGG